MSDERRDASDPARDEPITGLEGLYRDRPLPAPLEQRIVTDLTGTGLLGAPAAGRARRTDGGARRARGRTWLQAAAGLLLFAMGWGAGQMVGRTPAAGVATGDELPRFMLLLWDGPDFAPDAPGADLAAEYGAWAAGVADQGVLVSGDELSPERTLVSPGGVTAPGTQVPDGSLLGGYFLIAAPTAAAARALAVDHPHITHGGWIEVAPVVTR